MPLSKKTALVYDSGASLFLAERLGRDMGQVWFYRPHADPYPQAEKAAIGRGLANVEVIYSFWDYVEKADIIVFPDCHDGDLMAFLRRKGHSVFGPQYSSILENDKTVFYQLVSKLGLPLPDTHVAHGVDDLERFLKGKKNKWLKGAKYRGDFETYHYLSAPHLQPWLTNLRKQVGREGDDLVILAQDEIPAVCEVGFDGFCLDGKFNDNCLVGYEIKDNAYIGKVFPAAPPMLGTINAAFSPFFESHGYQGHYSTEVRVNKEGRCYFLDPTCRVPSPPGGLMSELYTNYSEIIYQLAKGVMPKPKPRARYGCELILTSLALKDRELYVEWPREYAAHIKLKNYTKPTPDTQGAYLIPSSSGEYVGEVCAWGDDIPTMLEQLTTVAKAVKADELEFHLDAMLELEDKVRNGEKYAAIKFN